MNINALSRGQSIPDGKFEGTVHSVFESALNVRLLNGTLLTILSANHANQPRGIRVNSEADFRSDQYHIREGDAVTCVAEIIRFFQSPLSIDMHSAHLWHSHLDSI